MTVRYLHSIQSHILDIPRESMQSLVNVANEGEEKIDLPISAIARRVHYVLDRQNFDGTRILNNDSTATYDDLNPAKSEC